MSKKISAERKQGFFNRSSGLLSFIGGVLVGAASVFAFLIDRIELDEKYEFMVGGTDAIRNEYRDQGWAERSHSFERSQRIQITRMASWFWKVTFLSCDIVDNKPPEDVRFDVGMDGENINVYGSGVQRNPNVRARLLVQIRTSPILVTQASERSTCQ